MAAAVRSYATVSVSELTWMHIKVTDQHPFDKNPAGFVLSVIS